MLSTFLDFLSSGSELLEDSDDSTLSLLRLFFTFLAIITSLEVTCVNACYEDG